MATHVNSKINAGNGWLPQGGTVTQDFGVQEYLPQFGINGPHQGIDVAAPAGSPVTLPSGQTAQVTKAYYDGTYGGGNTVQLLLSDGSLVDLFHLQSINVKAGQALNGGDMIGRVGMTGNATGPHLHFQIMQSGSAVDPWHWLTGLGSAVSGSTPAVGGSLNPFDAVKNINDFFGHLITPGHDPCSPPDGEIGVFRIIDGLTCPQNWWRVLFVGVGGMLIIGGVIVYFFQEEKRAAVQVVESAPMAMEV